MSIFSLPAEKVWRKNEILRAKVFHNDKKFVTIGNMFVRHDGCASESVWN